MKGRSNLAADIEIGDYLKDTEEDLRSLAAWLTLDDNIDDARRCLDALSSLKALHDGLAEAGLDEAKFPDKATPESPK